MPEKSHPASTDPISRTEARLLGKRLGEVNKLVALFQQYHVRSSDDLRLKLPTLAKHYFATLSTEDRKKLHVERLDKLFKEAIVVSSVPISNQKIQLQPDLEHILDLEKIGNKYESVARAKQEMQVRSDRLKERINKPEPVHVKNVVIGAGDAATEYWLAMHVGSHGRTEKVLDKDPNALPEVLMLAEGTGNWKHDYILAQRHGLLERANAPSSPENFTTAKNYRENRHVNARFLYQSNLVNLNETEAPLAWDTKVVAVEKRENHPDWEMGGAPCRVKIQITMGTTSARYPIATEPATTTLYRNLYHKEPSARELQNFRTQLSPLSTYVLTDLMLKSRFAQTAQTLNLPPDIGQKEFAKFMTIYLHDLQKIGMAVIPKAANEIVKPFLDEKGIPQIANGELIVVKERVIEKYIYTDQVNVCAGFGQARAPFPQQLPSTLEHLRHFNPGLGYTPIVDGNTFMLTSREEQPVAPKTEKRNIMIYGGGGNATACYRKAFFSQDTKDDRRYTAEGQAAGEILWFSRDGFELAGYGKLAKDAIHYANNNHQLISGELVKVEEGEKGKVILYFKDVPGTYEKKEVALSASLKSLHPREEIDNPLRPSERVIVRKYECDQFVYTIGQAPDVIKGIYPEFREDCSVFIDEKSKMPLGVKSRDGLIQFWGATAIVASPSHEATVAERVKDIARSESEYKDAMKSADEQASKTPTPQTELQKKQAEFSRYRIDEATARRDLTQDKMNKNVKDWVNHFNDSLRDWIVVQRIARDAEWPGVMPPSRVSARQAAFLKSNHLKNQMQTLDEQVKASRSKVQQTRELVEQKRGTPELKQAEREATAAIEALEQIKAQRRMAQTQFTSTNVNLDDIEYINGFLLRAGIADTNLRTSFLTALLQSREEAYQKEEFTGISDKTLDALLTQFGLQDKVTRQGHCSMTLRKVTV